MCDFPHSVASPVVDVGTEQYEQQFDCSVSASSARGRVRHARANRSAPVSDIDRTSEVLLTGPSNGLAQATDNFVRDHCHSRILNMKQALPSLSYLP